MPLAVGTRLGPYEILALLGAGGMGEVYRARDYSLGREVAIKVLPGSWSRDPERLQRFNVEAHSAAALNHPNIVSIFHVGEHEGSTYVVTELLRGETLRERINRGPMRLREVLVHGIELARGLAAAHDAGVTHRDLKPENIFLTKDGRIKIIDFGLAKFGSPRSGSGDEPTVSAQLLTDAGQVLGTVGYMSPEQVRGQTADARSDIFAAGAVIYEMLTGKRAFQKATAAETMSAILNEDPVPIPQSSVNLAPGLQGTVNHCLAKSPEQRFQHASDLGFALETSSDIGIATSTSIQQGTVHAGRKWIAGIFAAIVIIAGIGLWGPFPIGVPIVESVTRLTHDSERKSSDWWLQSLETDGRRVYFNEGESGSWKIAEVSVNGGQAAEIRTSLVSPAIAAMTPDASSLLVLTMPSGWPASAAGGSLWFPPLPGGEPEPLSGIVSTGAIITSDGHVVYGFGNALYIAQRDGSGSRKVVEVPDSYVGVATPSLSPDGTRAVFAAFRKDNGVDLWETAIDGANAHPLLVGDKNGLPGQLGAPKWTPDGKYLIFSAGRSTGRWDLWALFEGHHFLSNDVKPLRLTDGPLSYTSATPSRDGREIFAVGSQMQGELVQYNSGLKEFVPYLNGISALNPSFSKDGRWFAYVSYPEHDLWRARGDGTDRLRLTYMRLPVYCPHIAPDGSKVVFSTDEGTFLVNMSGGIPKTLNETVGCSEWTPDLNSITYASKTPGVGYGQKGSWRTSIQDVRTRAVTVLPNSEGRLGCWFFTQDLCFGISEDWLNFVQFSFKSQHWSELYTSPDRIAGFYLSPDLRYLYFRIAGKEPKVARLRISDRAVETITRMDNLHLAEDADITVAPDDSVLFTRDVGVQEIYSLMVKWPWPAR